MLINKAILALARLCPEEESRWTLGSISVENDSATVTNGHYLVNVSSGPRAHDENDFPTEPPVEHAKLASSAVLVAKTAALGALKAIKAAGKKLYPILQHAALTSDGQLIVNTLGSAQTFKSAVSGTFPNWRAVIPQGKPTAQIAVSAEYLRLLADYVTDHCAAEPRGTAAIRLTIYATDSAMRFDARTTDGQDVMAILMPLRMDKCEFPKRPDHKTAELVEEEKTAA
jgi:hypothetical protein